MNLFAKIFGKKFGETEYSLNLIPLGAFVKIYGEEGGVDDYRSFSNLAIYKRVLICLGGVLAFWIVAIPIFSFAFLFGARVPVGDQDVAGVGKTHLEIMSVEPNSPASQAGILKGDELVGFNKIVDFQAFVRDNAGKATAIQLNRQGKPVSVSLTPRTEVAPNQGPTGIAIERVAQVMDKKAWYLAPVYGVMYTGQVTWEALLGIGKFFANIFDGHGLPEGSQLAGPVGITIFLSRAVEYGIGFFLYFVGSLTVLLAIFNLFPIPALDGGKLVFLAIEKVMKKPVPVAWEQGLTMFFFFLLIVMSLFVTIRFDIPRVVEFWRAGS